MFQLNRGSNVHVNEFWIVSEASHIEAYWSILNSKWCPKPISTSSSVSCALLPKGSQGGNVSSVLCSGCVRWTERSVSVGLFGYDYSCFLIYCQSDNHLESPKSVFFFFVSTSYYTWKKIAMWNTSSSIVLRFHRQKNKMIYNALNETSSQWCNTNKNWIMHNGCTELHFAIKPI